METPLTLNVGDVLEWSLADLEPHRWRVRGVHLGAVGQESLVEIENVSHKPGWTGQWEIHQMMFVPECLLRGCKNLTSRDEIRNDSTISPMVRRVMERFWRRIDGLRPGALQ